MTLSKANPHSFIVQGKSYEYLAFYYPGNNTDWDNVYGVPYFGNFWVEPFSVQLTDKIATTFNCAEAAYQASKWWNNKAIVSRFQQAKDGSAAFDLKNDDFNNTPFDGQYGGYATGEDAMFEILKSKFSDDQPELKAALGATKHAYLLEHGAKLTHQDMVWSDGNDGYGTNHLGLCLMKVREYYFPGLGNPLEHEDSQTVIRACTAAVRTEMKKLNLSADNKCPTRTL